MVRSELVGYSRRRHSGFIPNIPHSSFEILRWEKSNALGGLYFERKDIQPNNLGDKFHYIVYDAIYLSVAQTPERKRTTTYIYEGLQNQFNRSSVHHKSKTSCSTKRFR